MVHVYVVNILTLGRLFSRVARDQQGLQQISHTQTSAAVNDSVVGRNITNVTCTNLNACNVSGRYRPTQTAITTTN